jgi:hypothetical protein
LSENLLKVDVEIKYKASILLVRQNIIEDSNIHNLIQIQMIHNHFPGKTLSLRSRNLLLGFPALKLYESEPIWSSSLVSFENLSLLDHLRLKKMLQGSLSSRKPNGIKKTLKVSKKGLIKKGGSKRVGFVCKAS